MSFGIFEDIYLAQVESVACLQPFKILFNLVAQAAAGLGINHHVIHGLNCDSRGWAGERQGIALPDGNLK